MKCCKCEEEHTFDVTIAGGGPVCDYHWIEWWHSIFTEDQKKQIREEDLPEIVFSTPGSPGMPTEKYRQAWYKYFKVTEDEIQGLHSRQDLQEAFQSRI